MLGSTNLTLLNYDINTNNERWDMNMLISMTTLPLNSSMAALELSNSGYENGVNQNSRGNFLQASIGQGNQMIRMKP
jgi:hypothetical protein